MIIIITFLIFFSFTLFTFYLFDRAVKLEYIKYKTNWIADGMPIGFFWIPDEARGELLKLPKLSSSIKRNRFASHWIYSTPEWARGDAQAAKVLFHYKLSALLNILLALVLTIFVFLK